MEYGKLLLALALLIIPSAHAGTWYFTEQMNFFTPRNHTQLINYTGDNVSVVVPAGFTVTNISHDGFESGGRVVWGAGTGRMVNFTMRSPASCTEGSAYEAQIINSTVQGKFVFVCTPDNKIVNYIGEYGHGDANYLTDLYISNETATIFNLIRIFNIGTYLSPNEPAANVQINCTFQKFPVRTYGRTEVAVGSSSVSGVFSWDIIEDGYWFRLGVLSQDVSGMSVGEKYNVTCTELTYNFTSHRVRANFTNTSLEIRNVNPFSVAVSKINDGLSYTITNAEVYTAESVAFRWQTGSFVKTESLPYIAPNESVKYDVILDGSSNVNLTISYIPSWYANSRNPKTYTMSNISAHNTNTNPASIRDINYVFLKSINTTVNNLTVNATIGNVTVQGGVPRVEMSNFGHLPKSGTYRARLLVFDSQGRPANATSNVSIFLYDSARALVINTTMSNDENQTGIYIYNYTLNSTARSGVWETIVEVNMSGIIVKPNDFWTIAASPAEVKINSIIDNTIQSIVADASITNEGDGDQEYQYEYCIVRDQANQCGGNDDEDYSSGAKLISPGQTFNPLLALSLENTGTYFFKLVVYYGVEASGASKQFEAVGQATQAVSSVSSGGGGSVETSELIFINFTQHLFSVGVSEKRKILFTVDGYTQYIIEIISVKKDYIDVKIRPDEISMRLDYKKPSNADIDFDGVQDIEIEYAEYSGVPSLQIKPLLKASSPCMEKWHCSDWKECTNDGLELRACVDENKCGTSARKPAEARSCSYGKKASEPQIIIQQYESESLAPKDVALFAIIISIIIASLMILENRRHDHREKVILQNIRKQ